MYVKKSVFLFLFARIDFVRGGDLQQYVREYGRVSLDQSRIWGSEMAHALNYLHDKDILFGDLKMANVMIDADGHIVLVDFGLSNQLLPPYKSHRVCGTYHYMAPGKNHIRPIAMQNIKFVYSNRDIPN